MAEDVPPPFDAARLIAEMRRGDPAAIEQAYRFTFGNDLGRLVLMHHLSQAGVGSVIGPHLGDGELRYAVGRHDAAIMLANAAGYDQAAIAAAVITDTLEGNDDERSAYTYAAAPLDDDDY